MLGEDLFSQKLMFNFFEQHFNKVMEDIPLKIKDSKNYKNVVTDSEGEEQVEHIDLEEQEDAALDG